MYLARTPAILRWLFPGAVWRIPARRRVLYLTFDDGPIPEVTPWVLDTLAQWHAKATFFCVGQNGERHSAILERIRQEGHAVGNHTWEHLRGRRASLRDYARSVLRAQAITGSTLFRPPYGSLRPAQYALLRKRFNVVLWDVLSGDFDTHVDASACTQNVIRNARPGSVIVFHDSLKAEPRLRATLPAVLEHFAAAGYTFEPLTLSPPPTR